MKGFYLFLCFLPFAFTVKGQISHEGLTGLSAGVHEEHDFAPVKAVQAASGDTYRFIFERSVIPDPELKESQRERFERVDGFVALGDESGEVVITVRTDMDEKDLVRILLIATRLYGYVGFKISQVN